MKILIGIFVIILFIFIVLILCSVAFNGVVGRNSILNKLDSSNCGDDYFNATIQDGYKNSKSVYKNIMICIILLVLAIFFYVLIWVYVFCCKNKKRSYKNRYLRKEINVNIKEEKPKPSMILVRKNEEKFGKTLNDQETYQDQNLSVVNNRLTYLDRNDYYNNHDKKKDTRLLSKKKDTELLPLKKDTLLSYNKKNYNNNNQVLMPDFKIQNNEPEVYKIPDLKKKASDYFYDSKNFDKKNL